MEGVYLKFYVGENQKHEGTLVYEWLLEQARSLGIHGGSAFRAIAGFGRHGVLHEDTFFELAGTLPVEVGFVATDEDAEKLLALVSQHGLELFHIKIRATYGVTEKGA
jgi:PII-like signaling protein